MGLRLCALLGEVDPGIDDEVVMQRANEANALLLTSDSDFGDLVFRQRKLSVGVILVRLSDLSPESKAGTERSHDEGK